ncbi:MAG: hypothetical protein COB51_01955 [Moraxellaceae bacterium]|nr:MAG: hypothetical protein COB51_01955 [Moraxellaceae bacterium]
MEELSEQMLSIKVIEQNNDSEVERSRVTINGKTTPSALKGAVLETCIQVKGFHLLFMTDDVLYEDMLHLHLINEDLSLIDSVTIGSIYSTGSFKLLGLVEPNTIKFSFIGGVEWSVQAFEKKQRHVPFLSDPKGVSRKACFRCHLKVEGTPLPETSKH